MRMMDKAAFTVGVSKMYSWWEWCVSMGGKRR